MDPNNSDQTNQPPQDAAPNDANQPQDDQNQPAAPEPVEPPAADQNFDQGQPAEAPLATDPQADQQQPPVQPQQADPSANDTQAQEDNYIEDVGGSVIDLLDDIDESADLLEIVANEMKLDNQRVKTILEGLLTKIDQGQLTTEELALIMAAPVVDEVDENQQ